MTEQILAALSQGGVPLAGALLLSYLLRQVTRQQAKIEAQQKEIDAMHATVNTVKDEHAEQKRQFRQIADSCPVTNIPCPLRKLFFGDGK